MDKSIDLGKLQDTVNFHKKQLAEGEKHLKTLKTNVERAQSQYDVRKKNNQTIAKLLDEAKQAMLEAARTVANV